MATVQSLEEELRGAETYEDYLDSFITDNDRIYLREAQLARQLVEVGSLRGKLCTEALLASIQTIPRGKTDGAVLSREAFYQKVEQLEEQRRTMGRLTQRVASAAGADLAATASSLMRQLSAREELVRSGVLSTIIFVRDRNPRGQEVSGYIDFAQRLKDDAFESYLKGEKTFVAKPTDLSYYNWATNQARTNDGVDFLVLGDQPNGLLFRHRRDRKLLDPNPWSPSPGDNSKRIEITTPELLQVVLYDHVCRKKC